MQILSHIFIKLPDTIQTLLMKNISRLFWKKNRKLNRILLRLIVIRKLRKELKKASIITFGRMKILVNLYLTLIG